MNNKLFVIVGPTASGKTRLSLECAKRLNGEIVSADSMQIYKGLDIGSAKLSEDEMEGIPHHMLSFVSPLDSYSVACYQFDAAKIINDIINRGKTPILVGGTGLYVNSLIYKMDFANTSPSKEIRDELNKLADDVGIIKLYNKLKEIDPETAARISQNDRKRIIRALEIFRSSGRTMSEHQNEDKMGLFDSVIIGLNMPRDILYDRINKRVDIMLSKGLLHEVKSLIELRCTKDMQSMSGIGYKELFDYFENNYSLNDAVELIRKNSRNYAKRQITWFKRYQNILWLDSNFYTLDELTNKAIEFYMNGGE